MSNTLHINQRLHFLAIHFSGLVCGKEVLQVAERVYDGFGVKSGVSILCDGMRIRGLDFSPGNLSALCRLITQHSARLGPGRTAIVGRLPEFVITAKLLKIVAPIAANRRLRVFEHLSEALRWLAEEPRLLGHRLLAGGTTAVAPVFDPFGIANRLIPKMAPTADTKEARMAQG